MTAIDTILLQFETLAPADLHRWIAARLVRPEGPPGAFRFHDMDVARIRLILDLRDTLEIDEAALPTVLNLLDQIYDMRRRMRRLNDVMQASLAQDVRARLAAVLDEDG